MYELGIPQFVYIFTFIGALGGTITQMIEMHFDDKPKKFIRALKFTLAIIAITNIVGLIIYGFIDIVLI